MGLCERCAKSQATCHVLNIEPDGEKSERHLCERCAIEEGQIAAPKMVSGIDEALGTLLAGAKAAAPDLQCDQCGITYVEFRNQGLLGCPHDYDAFKEPLEKLLKRAHDGATNHLGKAPRSVGSGKRTVEQDVRRLKRQLSEAIQAEDYERAAELRDRISELDHA